MPSAKWSTSKEPTWSSNVGGLTELAAERNGPMLVFANSPVIRQDIECAPTQTGRFDGLPWRWTCRSTFIRLELLRRWRDKRAGSAPVSAKVVKDGPILTNVQQSEDVNIESFPAPRWHPGDGRALHRHARTW